MTLFATVTGRGDNRIYTVYIICSILIMHCRCFDISAMAIFH